MTSRSEDAAPRPEEAVRDMLGAAEPEGSRRLGELVERLEGEGRLRTVRPAGDGAIGSREVRGVAFDSRCVRAGYLFVAIPGAHSDGHDFIGAAAALGACAAIVESPAAGAAIPQIVVMDSRAALACAAAWWFRDPSRELGVVGITGTDGKTTTSFLVTAMLEAVGISTGMVTTAAVKIGPVRSANAEHITTPEAPELQKMLRAMVSAGNEAAVVETTSHGLALERVGSIDYDIAVFTNLSHEHLELHGSFEAYRDAKLSLFRRLLRRSRELKHAGRDWPRAAIVNVDDAASSHFERAARDAGATLITYGLRESAMVRATEVAEDTRSMRIDVVTPRWSDRVELQLAGRFNVHNALASIAVGEALGLPPEAIRAGLAGVAGVPGRMERVECGQPFGVIVDYAHSPASLEKVLDLLAPLAQAQGGGLIVVFGSAGERDVQKRPMMGRIAGERCRLVVVTDEDPRGEDSGAILRQIADGALAAGGTSSRDVRCIADRAQAIAAAFEAARPGDVVLLAGKGHEQSIIMADGPRPWDERSEAVKALGRLGFGQGQENREEGRT